MASSLAPTRHLLLRVAYRGTRLLGVQEQPQGPTVLSELRSALATVLDHPVHPRVASRTDAGVHGLDLPVALETRSRIPLRGLLRGANACLPEDVRVVRVLVFDAAIAPRASSRGKVYRYLVGDGPVASPMLAGLTWHVRERLDLGRITADLAAFRGGHDFSAFRARGCTAEHAIRYMTRVRAGRLRDAPDIVRFDVAGNAFVRNQVRIMVGTLVDRALGRRRVPPVAELLRCGDRGRAGRTAPAHGLYLASVRLRTAAATDAWPVERRDPSQLFPGLFGPLGEPR